MLSRRSAVGREKPPPPPANDVEWLAQRSADPFAEAHRMMARPEYQFRNVMGLDHNFNLVFTEPRRNCLIMGPPRCFKSTGVLVPQMLMAPGPVVSTSVREDIYMATGQSRARRGTLWHLDLDKDMGLLPGCRPLRWSPITASVDWGKANITGHGMAAQAEAAEGSMNATYFRHQAGSLISGLLHAAALGGKDLGWIMSAASGNTRFLEDAQAIVRSDGHHLALDPLRSIVSLDSRTQGPILTTAQNCFIAFRDPKAYESTLNPNFDPFAFAAGQPEVMNEAMFDHIDRHFADNGIWDESPVHRWPWGIYDTVYITAPTQMQSVVAPLITGLLAEIREATFRNNSQANLEGRPAPAPVFWALDEVANIAPLADMPETAAQGAGQGLLVSIVLQELSQAEKRWKQDHKSFLTLFADQVIFPGIANRETLDALSALFGKYWHSREQISVSQGQTTGREPTSSTNTTTSQREDLLPVLDPAEIGHGRMREDGPAHMRDPRSGQDNRRVLFIKGAGAQWQWGYAMPYFNTPPIAHMCITNMEHAASQVSSLDIRSRVSMPKISQQWAEFADPSLVPRMQNLLGDLDGLGHRFDFSGDLYRRSPLMQGWTDDFVVRDATLFPARSVDATILSVRMVNVPEEFAGFSLNETDPGHWPGIRPQRLFWWQFDQAKFELAQYLDPASIDQLLGFLGLADVNRPSEVVVVRSYDRLGQFLAGKLARSIGAPVILWPDRLEELV